MSFSNTRIPEKLSNFTIKLLKKKTIKSHEFHYKVLRIYSKLRIENLPKSDHDFGCSFESFASSKIGERWLKTGHDFALNEKK